MKIQEIRSLAKERGLKLANNATKADAIRAIQRQEGNVDCFARADSNYCDQKGCLWRGDCLPEPKKMKA